MTTLTGTAAASARSETGVPAAAGTVIVLAAAVMFMLPYPVDHEVTLLPWLIRRGWTMYGDIADHHSPLLPWMLAVVTGGDPGVPLRLVVVSIHAVTMWLSFRLASIVAGFTAGLVAVALTALWIVTLDGNRLWYDMALAPVFLMMVIMAVEDDASTRHAFALGLAVGIGGMIKQHAFLVAPFAVVALSMHQTRTIAFRRVLRFAIGVGLPALCAALVFWWQGTLRDAWYWIVEYNFTGGYAEAAALAPSTAAVWMVVPLFAAVPALVLTAREIPLRRGDGVWVVYGGALIAALAPAYPRWGAFHLQAAVPLIGVAAGIAAAAPLRGPDGSPRLASIVGMILVAASAVGGSMGLPPVVRVSRLMGPPLEPYAGSIAPLRAWVDANAGDAPIFIYALDQLLYTPLRREPVRPWAPQLPWIMRAHGTDDRVWAAVERVRPNVVLVPANGWIASAAAGSQSGEARLRRNYHEAARFAVACCPLAPSTTVVGLVRNDAERH